ncbi:hypothetical protein V6N13_106843 [Hibiscus sabdariffa]|uniref:Transmembrane protein n=1 Tax=Hibiscus sabdariffa TaxID=183260 RepID=A0ABR2F1Y6_9ROSI
MRAFDLRQRLCPPQGLANELGKKNSLTTRWWFRRRFFLLVATGFGSVCARCTGSSTVVGVDFYLQWPLSLRLHGFFPTLHPFLTGSVSFDRSPVDLGLTAKGFGSLFSVVNVDPAPWNTHRLFRPPRLSRKADPSLVMTHGSTHLSLMSFRSISASFVRLPVTIFSHDLYALLGMSCFLGPWCLLYVVMFTFFE